MITAGGKNLTPANLENDLKRSRWISQAVMHADRRPFPVALITLDPEEIVHFAREHELPEDVAALHREPKVIELIQGELDRVNENYARVEQIKRFFILDHDLSQETGRADADAEGQAQRGQRALRGGLREALRVLTAADWRSRAPVVCSRIRRQARVFSRSAEKWRTTLRTRVAEISMPWRRQTSRISS